MATVKLNGVKFNYKLEGEGAETIVLINGLADDLETWMEQMPDFLAAGYRVLRFDNRGIGKSGRPRGPYTTAQMAADAKALVDHLKIKSFHLVGVSMGGMIAQEYALAHGRDLRSLTLCCTYAAPGPVLLAHVRPMAGHGQEDGRADGDARRDAVGLHAGFLRRRARTC